MTYHETIIDLIYHILNGGVEYLKNIDKGNAYDKIIRNYHQFNSNGDKCYRNKKSKDFYKFSDTAWTANKKDWYYEHLIPVKLIKEKLNKLIDDRQVSKENICQILNETEFVVITKEEAKKVDAFPKNKIDIAKDGRTRLEVVGIMIHPESKKNNLGIIKIETLLTKPKLH